MSQSQITEKFHTDFETLCIKSSRRPEKFSSRPMVVPIYTTVVHALDEPYYEGTTKNCDETNLYLHGRKGHPTRDVLEGLLAELEGCRHALTFASGSAAINCVLQSFLKCNDHVVASETLYGGTTAILKEFRRFGVDTDFVASFSSSEITAKIKPTTKVLWMETPANPTMYVIDIEETCKMARMKSPDIIIIVDNTFMTPMFQRPLELGADITMMSCSKYLCGHADMFLGSLACNSDEIYSVLRTAQEVYGAIPSPYDCYNLLRSLKTFAIRMQRHCDNGLKVAQFLEKHPCVEKVIYPGLKSHPQHHVVLKQQTGSSGGIALYVKGGKEEANKFVKSLKVVALTSSIGADFSIVNLPSKLSHADISQEEQTRIGITENLIRLSVGLEKADAIINDLDQALRHSVKNAK